MTEVQLIYDNLEKAACPEDVLSGGDELSLKKSFNFLARSVHPDIHGNSAVTRDAFSLLCSIRDEALHRIKAGTWGKRIPLDSAKPIEIGSYSVSKKTVVGDIADVYPGKDFVVKVARSHDDNDLLQAEKIALQALNSKVTTAVGDGFPKFIDSISLQGTGGWKRSANVLSRFPNFVTAAAVHSKLPSIEPRTLVWMFKRLLVLLEWTHHCGYVHGAILPPHVLFYPDNDGNTTTRDPRKHSIRVVDWCYALEYKQRTRLSAWVPAWKDHYPPEIVNKVSIGPFSDLYMAAKLIMYLAGNETIPSELQKVLTRCMEPDPTLRYQKAGEAFTDWVAASKSVYGSPKWQGFHLPR